MAATFVKGAKGNHFMSEFGQWHDAGCGHYDGIWSETLLQFYFKH